MGRKQQIISLIESDSLLHTAVGMILKIFFEWLTVAIASAPIIFILPFLVDGITVSLQPVPKSSITIWATVSVAVLKTAWCFTKRGIVEL